MFVAVRRPNVWKPLLTMFGDMWKNLSSKFSSYGSPGPCVYSYIGELRGGNATF